jgi:hypothetical protein
MSAIKGGSGSIDAVHSRAICEEVGERLRELLSRGPQPELPARLKYLMERLAQADLVASPSIVPSLDPMAETDEVSSHEIADRGRRVEELA